MIHHVPPGWRKNPSSFSRRARNASAAAVAAALVLRLDATPSALAASTAFVLLVAGALSLLGGSHRWAIRPWLVFVLGFVAVPISLVNTTLVVVAHVVSREVSSLELAFVGLTCALAASVMDENLASAQMVRRHTDHGRVIWRAFFGLHSRRRAGRAVTLDDVLDRKPEGS